MYDAYSRMELLLGQAGVDRLGRAKIAVFGLGGAGSYAVEALARCGVGSLTLVDHEVCVCHQHQQAAVCPAVHRWEKKECRSRRRGSGTLTKTFWCIHMRPSITKIQLEMFDLRAV